MPHPVLAATPWPRVLAHRGLVTAELAERGVADNTHAAFAAALAAGATHIETDCHITRDREVVLAHDPDLARIAGDPRRISDVTRAEFAAALRDRGGALTLADALTAFPEARLNLDVKSAAAAEPAGRIIASHTNRVLVTSFSDGTRERALRAAAVAGGRLPATSAGQATILRLLRALAGPRRSVAAALAGVDALQIPERQGPIPVLSDRLLAAAHAHGVEVHVWTVNDPERMAVLHARGVDGIVTDRADLAVRALGLAPQDS